VSWVLDTTTIETGQYITKIVNRRRPRHMSLRPYTVALYHGFKNIGQVMYGTALWDTYTVRLTA